MQGKLDMHCSIHVTSNFEGSLQNNNTALLQDLFTLTGKMPNGFKSDEGFQDE